MVSYLCHLLLLLLAPSLAVAIKSQVFQGVPSEYLGSLWLRLALFPSPHRSSMNSLTYSLDYGCPNGRESAVGKVLYDVGRIG